MNRKRSIVRIFAIVIIAMLACVMLPRMNVQAATAVKVKMTRKYENDSQYFIIKGLDSAGKKVWKYKTSKCDATELDSARMKVKGKYVYVIDDKKFIRIKKSNGEAVVKKKFTDDNAIWGTTMLVDEDKNTYAIGYYNSELYKINKNGKVLWSRSFDEKYYWATKLTKDGKKLTVTFEGAEYQGDYSVNAETGKDWK